MIISTMTTNELINNSEPDVYNARFKQDGYQRPLVESHVKLLKEYLSSEDYSILPTSIILAIDKKNINLMSSDYLEFRGKFRIIDGQHRIAAMERVIKELEAEAEFEDDDTRADILADIHEFESTMYPVNILLLDQDSQIDRYIEVRSFIDINKKGKPVSTDLADNNMNRILGFMPELKKRQAVYQICLNLANRLNRTESSVWFNNIRMGDGESFERTIGLGQFSKSLINLSRLYLKYVYNKSRYTKLEIDEVTNQLYFSLHDYWTGICSAWKEVFIYDPKSNTYKANPEHSILKGLGVFPIHKVLSSNYKCTRDIDEAVSRSLHTIIKSKERLGAGFWQVGGELSSKSSISGYLDIYKTLTEDDTV